MLIFKDQTGTYIAKVVDFGYSTLYAGQNSLINMPDSRPWSAPEYHHRGFKPAEAMKMDTFCLGLLCFWLVHKEGLSSKSSTAFDGLGGDRCSTSCPSPCWKHQLLNLAKLKSEDDLVAFSDRATILLDLSEEQKTG